MFYKWGGSDILSISTFNHYSRILKVVLLQKKYSLGSCNILISTDLALLNGAARDDAPMTTLHRGRHRARLEVKLTEAKHEQCQIIVKKETEQNNLYFARKTSFKKIQARQKRERRKKIVQELQRGPPMRTGASKRGSTEERRKNKNVVTRGKQQ